MSLLVVSNMGCDEFRPTKVVVVGGGIATFKDGRRWLKFEGFGPLGGFDEWRFVGFVSRLE